MFKGIFDKWRAESEGKREERELSVAPIVVPAADSVDESLLRLSRELSGLTVLPVSAAAKERGWAKLQREMERRPIQAVGKNVRAANSRGVPVAGGAGSGSASRTVRPRNLRWGLASAAGVVAVVAALLGAYSGGLLPTAGNGDGPGPGTSVVSADTTSSATAPSDDNAATVPTTAGPVTTGPDASPGTTGGGPDASDGPVTTEGSVTTEDTQPTTPVTTRPTTSATTSAPGTTVGPSTTQPTPTTAPSEQQMAAAQRVGSAKAAAAYLADSVVTGNHSGARAVVVPEALDSLAQMIVSLTEPYGYKITGSQVLDSETVRVTLQVNDRVVNNVGEVVEIVKRFVVRVHVSGGDAVITAIGGGS